MNKPNFRVGQATKKVQFFLSKSIYLTHRTNAIIQASLLFILVILAASSTGYAYAYFQTSKTLTVAGQVGNLKIGSDFPVSLSIGENVKPGDSGKMTIPVQNAGTVAAKLSATAKSVPDFLSLQFEPNENAIGPDETGNLILSWAIDKDATLGEGGQKIQFSVVVTLTQVIPE